MSTSKLSRRRFLHAAGVAVGTSVLACSGITIIGLQEPEVDYAESTHGAVSDQSRILVAYASKAGSTGEVADAIGRRLGENGFATDVSQIDDRLDLTAYKAVVLGSAIRMGQWLSGAKEYVESRQSTLRGIPTAFFTVCGTLREDTEENRREVQAYTESIRQLVTPTDEAFFAGVVELNKLSHFDGLVMRMLKVPEGDNRDWNAIHAWADGLVSSLLTA